MGECYIEWKSSLCWGDFNGWCEVVEVGGDYVCRFYWNYSCRYMGIVYFND